MYLAISSVKILLIRWKWEQLQPLMTIFAECFLSLPGSLHIFMYEWRWENGADGCCFCSMGGGNTWNRSWVVSTKSSSYSHLSAPPQRAILFLTVTQGQLKAAGLERYLCAHVWAHMCSPAISSDEPQEAFQVSQCFTPLASPCASFFVPASSPPAHNLSVMTHTLAGFDLDSHLPSQPVTSQFFCNTL